MPISTSMRDWIPADCGALWKFCDGNAENQARVGEVGGIEAVVAAMRSHSGELGLQEEGCALLISITEDHAENRARVRAAGGVEVVTAAMASHPEVAECRS